MGLIAVFDDKRGEKPNRRSIYPENQSPRLTEPLHDYERIWQSFNEYFLRQCAQYHFCSY